MNRVIPLLAFSILLLVPLGVHSIDAVLCTAPDNGGTVTNPISSCDYATNPDDPLKIINGLPAGDTIEFAAILEDLDQNGPPPPFVATINIPGGNLGGEIEQDIGIIEFDVDGTGALSFFQRTLFLTVTTDGHSAPRNAGDPVQSFDTEMVTIDGELIGDPDFCTFRIKAGSSIPLPPSPGQTQLTDLGANFQVDSFFDITYTIEFVGCPGSALEGFGGTTEGTVRILTQDLDGDGLPDGLDSAPNNPCSPNPTARSCNPVGGTGLSIESSALILAGAQSFSWIIPVVLSVLGIGLVLSRKI